MSELGANDILCRRTTDTASVMEDSIWPIPRQREAIELVNDKKPEGMYALIAI